MTALSHLTTPTGTESLPISLPTYPTQRSLIRRAKTAHGIKAQHKAHEAIGPAGEAYILRIPFWGLMQNFYDCEVIYKQTMENKNANN